MHHRPGGLLRGSFTAAAADPAPSERGRPGGGVGGRLRQPGSLPVLHTSPRQGPGPPTGPPPSLCSSPVPTEPAKRRKWPPDGCCRAVVLISLYIWGREKRVGRYCCRWRLLTQIIIIKKNRYSWVLAEYGNYQYCQSRLEIIILKAGRLQLPRCFE